MKFVILRGLSLLCLTFGLVACNINVQPDEAPTPERLVTETLTPTPSVSPTLTATLTPSPTVQVLLRPTQDAPVQPVLPNQPTLEPSPAPTEGAYEYVIRPNDTLGYILQLQPWGYPPYDPGVIQAVVTLNRLASADFLPPPGTTLLIPRRTPTPVPVGIELTLTSDASLGLGERVGNATLPQGAVAGCYTVKEGDTIVGIADNFNTTLEIMSQLNQNLNWFGCQFDQYSGGPNCNVFITIGQCINVPLPTPTPVPTATLTGNETPTPTPTYAPARAVFPPFGAVAPPTTFELQWVSVGILKVDEVYLVEVQDLTGGQQWLQVTRQTSIALPESLIPNTGQTHQMQWRVSVAKADENGVYSYVGGVGAWRAFQWQSR